MKKTKKLLVTLCFCLITALMLPAIVPNMEYVSTYQAATKVKLNKTKAYVTKGDKLQLKVTGTSAKVKWSSSNKKIATVTSKGVVKGGKKGTATITAKVNGKTFKCKVTVETPKISKSKASVNKGKTITLSIKNTKQKVKWSSSNKKIATVNSKGVVKGIKKGTVTITAKVGNKKYTCKITVKNVVALKSISLNKSKLTLEEGDDYQLKVKYNPTNTTVDKTIEWTSSDKDVVIVDEDGYIEAVGEGTATITANVEDKEATCQVTVGSASEWNDINKAALGVILYKNFLKDPNSFVMYSAVSGTKDAEYGDGSKYYDIETIIIDCGAKNSYGGMVRKYLCINIHPKESEPLVWIEHECIPDGEYLTYSTYSNSMPTLSNKEKLNIKDIEEAIECFEEEYEYEIYGGY